jgi:hypothetical protein
VTYKSALPILILTFSLGVAACGGSGGDEPPPEPAEPTDPDPGGSGSGDDPDETFSIGGSVSGLTGSGLVISNSATDELTLNADGAFTFTTELDDGDAYDVTVVTQPTVPDNVCTVENGSGDVAGADVTDVEIFCTGPLVLASSAPAENDQDVSRAIEPLLTFSADIDAGTVVTGAITLASNAGEVDITFDVSGEEVTLTPDATLLPLTEYTLTVTTDIAGSGGERMLEPVTVTFRTRDAAWQADVAISLQNVDTGEARIAFDRDGNALALWTQGPIDRSEIWWNTFTAGVGWDTAAPLEQSAANVYADGARLGFGPDGSALAVWTLHDITSADNSVRSSRYVPGSGWETPEFIETHPGEVFGKPDLAVNSQGDAVAVWVHFDGTFMNLWANRYTAGSGWGTAEIIDESDDVVENPRVAINGAGDIVAVWPMRDLGSFDWDVWSRRYAPGAGWASSELVSVNNTFEAIQPRPVLDEDGNALVVWVQGLGLDAALHASRHTGTGGWTSEQELDVSGSVDDPQIAIDPAGNAIAVWRRQQDVNGMLEMLPYAARHTAGGWSTPQAIGNRTAFDPKVAMDLTGHAIAVWQEIDPALPFTDASAVWGNRYTIDNGWTSAERIGSYGQQIGIDTPNVAVDPSGDAFAIWTRLGDVHVNRFE